MMSPPVGCTAIAGAVVFFELWAIAYIRMRYMDTPFLQAAFQIVVGGAIVLGVGILIGASPKRRLGGTGVRGSADEWRKQGRWQCAFPRERRRGLAPDWGSVMTLSASA